MNVSNLIIQLQEKLNDSTYNQLAISKSIELLKLGRVQFVNSLGELPSPIDSPEGELYFVSNDGLYYNNKILWVPIYKIAELSIWSWGLNNIGQLGDNTLISKQSPVSVVGGFTDWCQVSAGQSHIIALRQNGTIWSWGSNGQGRLGDNTTISRSSPVSVVGGFTDWCQVSAGGYHSLAVRQDGTIWSWGSNGQGHLGDNTTISRSSPVSVVGGFTDWCQVSAGWIHSLAVRQNGTVWAWGYNGQGRLGDNTITNISSPVSVVGGFTDWCQISAGACHSLAMRQNGTIWSWGLNYIGQLGDNTVISKRSPVSVVSGFTDWCQVSAGTQNSSAIRQNGTIWSWGLSCVGQLGDNTIAAKSSPVSVVGGFTDWCQVSVGNLHMSAIRQNGTAWSWGHNHVGQLGDNTITNRSSPVSVVGGFTDWFIITTGWCNTSAIRAKIE